MAQVNSYIPIDEDGTIVNQERWAKSFPPFGSRPPVFQAITVDNGYGSRFEIWSIQPLDEGYVIQNKGNGLYAYGKDGEVSTSNKNSATDGKWYLESTGNNTFKIKVPNQDLVWTVKPSEYGHTSVFLAPADGNDNQNFSFHPSRVAED